MFTRSLLVGLTKRFVLALLLATLVFAIPRRARADPVPIQSSIPVFCFRITDIERVAPGSNKFRIEFEVLNWTHEPAYGVYIALNVGTGVKIVGGSPPFFAGASIDSDGRPLVLIDVNGDGNINAADLEDTNGLNGNGLLDPGEDKNGNGRLDNDPIPGNLNPSNDWTVALSTTTAITWSAGTPVSAVDLTRFPFGPPVQPGDPEIPFILFTNLADPTTIVLETIDDGPNVLDGYVIEVDDFDPGEILSFNWFLTDANGNIISDPSGEFGVNPYGFGVVNLTSLDGPAFPGAVFSGNTGFSQSPKLFFDSVYVVPNPAQFAAEFGAAMTAAFLNPDDNLFNIPVTTQLLNRLDVTPGTATNSVGTDHTVTATLTDGQHNPVAGQTIEFRVSGANIATGQSTTDATGQATFTYTGTNAGDDTITAWADENGDGIQDLTEPFDVVTKSWVGVGVMSVNIDIKPGKIPNRIEIESEEEAGKIPVAILSTSQFDASQQVDQNSLTFGRIGDEHSLRHRGHADTPDCRTREVNHDGLLDLVCRFLTRKTGFQPGDIEGILKGQTIDGVSIEGRDSVVIVRDNEEEHEHEHKHEHDHEDD